MKSNLDRSGKNNPNYRHGRWAFGHTCKECGISIDPRATRCSKCANSLDNPFKGRKHKKKSKKIIGIKSKNKFTKEYLKKYRQKYLGRKRKIELGYILTFLPDHPDSNSAGYIFEHRLIMEGMVGRRLQKEECIHHINFIRSDNRPENLYLCTNRKIHREMETTIHRLIPQLFDQEVIQFEKGEYKMRGQEVKLAGQGEIE